MAYTKNSPEWRSIIESNPIWFSPSTMRVWNCKVLWSTLTPVGDEWLFLSLDDNFDRSEQLYSVRVASVINKRIDTLSFLNTNNLVEAELVLAYHRRDLQSRQPNFFAF
jgi:hypothetical protein